MDNRTHRAATPTDEKDPAMKITITQTEGNQAGDQPFANFSDVHGRRFEIAIDGTVCGVIFHAGNIGWKNGRLDRGQWEAHVCGRRIAVEPQLSRINGAARRALKDVDTLQLVLDGAGQQADKALMMGEDARFEERAKVARIVAAAIRETFELEA
jgi:hypothetical protein